MARILDGYIAPSYEDLMLKRNTGLFVPDPKPVPVPPPYRDEPEYRVPSIEEFVDGFTFEYLLRGKWEPCYVYKATSESVHYRTTDDRVIMAMTKSRYGVSGEKERCRTSAPATGGVLAWCERNEVFMGKLKEPPSRKEITSLTLLIEEAQCQECKSIIFFTHQSSQECALCEARQLRNDNG